MNECMLNFKLFVADRLHWVGGSAQKVLCYWRFDKACQVSTEELSKLSGMREKVDKKWWRKTAQVGKIRTDKAAANRWNVI